MKKKYPKWITDAAYEIVFHKIIVKNRDIADKYITEYAVKVYSDIINRHHQCLRDDIYRALARIAVKTLTIAMIIWYLLLR